MRTRALGRPVSAILVLLALGTALMLPGCPFFTRAERSPEGGAAAAPAAAPPGH